MGLGKKLSTLINATLRGGFSGRRRRYRPAKGDPQAQLQAIQEALAEVEVKERQMADRLQETRANLEAAIDRGDREEAASQRRLAATLEAQLKTQSTEAVHLAEKLSVVEASLTEKKATAEKDDTPSAVTAQDLNDQPPASDPSHASPPVDNELSARKNRLSK